MKIKIKHPPGKIRLELRGGFPEKFIDECNKKNISLEKFRIKGDKTEVKAAYEYAGELILLSEKSGMEVKKKEPEGLPLVLSFFAGRPGIPAGIIISVLIFIYLFSSVWSIEITGNNFIPDEKILESLSFAGIYKGAKRRDISCNDAEFILEQSSADIISAIVNIAGTDIKVSIKERKKTEEITDESDFSNIIAAKDGEVIKATVTEGEAAVSPGDAVLKGDMLINGVVTRADGSVRFVNSKGSVLGRTENKTEIRYKNDTEYKKTAGRTGRIRLCIFGIEIPLYTELKNRYSETEYFLDGGNVIFPVGLIKIFCPDFSDSVMLTSDEARLLALCCFSEQTAPLYENTVVEKCSFYEKPESLGANFVCTEEIGYKKSFTVDELHQQ